MLSLQTTSTSAQTYPSSSSSPTSPRERESDSLSHRCRRLAASIGASAKAEQQFDQQCRPLTTLSNRVSPPVSPAKTSANPRSPLPPPPSPSSSLSTSLNTSPTRSLEGSFTLQEIHEDPMEDGKEEEEEVEDEGMKTPVSRGGGGLGLTGLGSMRGSSDSLSLEFQGGAKGLSRVTETLDQLGAGAAKVEDRLSLVRDALKNGVDTLEVKVWLVEGELLYGENRESLSPLRTLSSTYLEPLQELLVPQGATVLGHHRRRSSASSFTQITTSHPFSLRLSFQTNPSQTFSYLLHALEPLRDSSLLTTYCPNSNLTYPGLLTIYCVGPFVPLAELEALSPKFVFWQEEI